MASNVAGLIRTTRNTATMGTTRFTVWGPLDVPYDLRNGRKVIGSGHGRDFFRSHADLGQRIGCYVFGMRASQGLTPWYVGQAKVSFSQEVFAPHKLEKYRSVLRMYIKGRPIMYLVCADDMVGRKPVNRIKDLEEYLIGAAEEANKGVVNIQGLNRKAWLIRGISSGKGRTSQASQSFRKLMKW